jgi:hypothetical protein
VPNAAYLEWSGVPGATGYNVYRSDLGLLTPTPLAPTIQQGQSYTHRALLGDGQFTYRIVALYANGCGLTETTERSKVNSMSLALSLSSNVGQVNIVWSVPQDPDVSGAIIQGPGLPPAGADIKRTAQRTGGGPSTGYTFATGVPKGVQTYTATAYWDAPGGQFKAMPISTTVTVP